MKSIFYGFGFVFLLIFIICLGMLDSEEVIYIAIATVISATLASMSLNIAYRLDKGENKDE